MNSMYKLDTLEKAQAAWDREDGVLLMNKGQGLPVGTVRDWEGEKFRKEAPGKWVPEGNGDKKEAPGGGESNPLKLLDAAITTGTIQAVEKFHAAMPAGDEKSALGKQITEFNDSVSAWKEKNPNKYAVNKGEVNQFGGSAEDKTKLRGIVTKLKGYKANASK